MTKTDVLKQLAATESTRLPVELARFVGIVRTNLNCYVPCNQYSRNVMNYTTFPSEAKYNIIYVFYV